VQLSLTVKGELNDSGICRPAKEKRF
jgi:hypothetical protein